MHLATLFLLAAAATTAAACRPAGAEPPRAATRTADIHLSRDSSVLAAIVPARTTLAAVLHSHRLPPPEITAVINTAAAQFDLRRFRSGQSYRLDRFHDGRLREFEYEIDLDTRLIVRRQGGDSPAFAAALAPIPKTYTEVTVEATIDAATPSLVQALDAAGERIELSLALAEVLAGEIDFNNDVQPGDNFRLVVTRAAREDGSFGGYGPILATEFVNDGRVLQAIRFTPPNGEPGYYDADGRSLKRFFLKSPLKFEPRITSRFSRSRLHPILNYRRAHNGVDYAAPAGAPVAAVASGVVVVAGWSGGGGRTVKIRHASGYQSEYLHLSSIAVRTGARVTQGDLIGRVGSSGLATAAHLHYGLKRDGAYVNPVREHRNMPPGEPVPATLRVAFEDTRARLFDRLVGARAANNN